MKCLVIPDIHLKPFIFDEADKILSSGKAEIAVQLGDISDDFGATATEYLETFEKAVEFAKKYPETKWCWGNHDYAYVFNISNLTGHQFWASNIVVPAFDTINKISEIKVVHKIDNVLFSHAGITDFFTEVCNSENTEKNLDADFIVDEINSMRTDTLWTDDSPLWTRPQFYKTKMYDFVQVVGHTPLQKVEKRGKLISVDVFSTRTDGSKYGEERFIIIDTETGEFEYAD